MLFGFKYESFSLFLTPGFAVARGLFPSAWLASRRRTTIALSGFPARRGDDTQTPPHDARARRAGAFPATLASAASD